MRIAATPGLVTIAPPGSGDVAVPPTRLRVPGILIVTTEPTGEGAEYSPLALELSVGLMDRTTGLTAVTGMWQHVAAGRATHRRLALRDLQADRASDLRRRRVTPTALAAIRLPALLRRALRHVVLLVTDEGYSIDPADLDERAIAAYVTAQLIGEHPTKAVAAELGINANAAAQRVYRLRQDGRLPAVTKKGTAQWATAPSPSASSRSGRWQARPAGVDPATFDSHDEAEAWCLEQLVARSRGTAAPPGTSRLTFRAYAEEWRGRAAVVAGDPGTRPDQPAAAPVPPHRRRRRSPGCGPPSCRPSSPLSPTSWRPSTRRAPSSNTSARCSMARSPTASSPRARPLGCDSPAPTTNRSSSPRSTRCGPSPTASTRATGLSSSSAPGSGCARARRSP